MQKENLSGFNTTVQNVEKRYEWINDMIRSRQRLVVEYMELVRLDPAAATPATGSAVVSFCEHLIDYVSHGHFDLYPKILTLIENASGRSLSIAHRVLPRIDKTTEFLMRFNDRYAEDPESVNLSSLKQDLSAVGKCLEQRFKNEDRLIIGLRLVHTIVATPEIAK